MGTKLQLYQLHSLTHTHAHAPAHTYIMVPVKTLFKLPIHLYTVDLFKFEGTRHVEAAC